MNNDNNDNKDNSNRYKDWSLQLKEHQRALLELLIAKFPEVLTTKAKEVAVWRKRLTVSAGKH